MRKIIVSKPKAVSAKPATKAAKPAAKPVKVAATPAVAKPSANITRTAATIVANATNFGNLSDRDSAYIAFYASLAKANGGTVTLANIVASGRRPVMPAGNSSAKPHDAGVVNRLGKAGLISRAADGHSFTFTDKAKSLAAYSGAAR